ncbi:MAG: bacteriohopanetetrol glucosamine biosynthesis glycosyltransferase HpnI [Nevskia sp.]
MHAANVFRAAGYCLLFSSAAYIVLSLVAVWLHRGRDAVAGAMPGVTILKPLCGDEPRLYENLRSFCEQDHPQYQILFGVREAGDPAIAVARRLAAEFPERDIALVVDGRVHGVNLKISNVMNLLPHARHDWLVLADSDIAVRPDYLRSVTAPLARPDVGLVTCLYRGRALGNLWSRLGTQFIDDWFRPSVRLSQLFGAERHGFGASLALRRETLSAIGGFETLAGLVADDYWLGERVADLGLRTVLSGHEVVTDVVETTLAELAQRELRWFRTIRSVRPGSYLGTGVCFTLPVALAGLALAGPAPMAVGLAVTAIGCRCLLFLEGQASGAARQPGEGLRNFSAFLLRDSLSLLLWAWAFRGARVRWRGQQIDIDNSVPARTS